MPITKHCRECGARFTIEESMFSRLVLACGPCSEQIIAEREYSDKQRAIEQRAVAWSEVCPADFMDTEEQKLPRLKLFRSVLEWKFGPTGLLLHGGTGLGKSRSAWKLCEREFMVGRSVRVLDVSSGLDYAATYSRSASAVSEWIDEYIACSILLLDDIFNVKLTESFEASLFSVVLKRGQKKKPMIITTNDIGATLLKRLSSERGPAFVRRLKEQTKTIAFV